MPGSYTRDLSVSEKDSTSSLNSARLVLVLLLFAILFAAASDAVAAPEEPPGAATQTPIPQDAATISEFRIAYVAVTDKAGAPITDLKREDFSVSENGVPQRLVDLLTTSKVHLVLGLVIDVSGSAVAQTARHDRLNVLLTFLARSVGSNEEAYITAFGIRALRLTGVTNNPVELREGLKQVDAAHPHGGTALFDSLISVVSAIPPDMPGRRVLVVMSDFEENSSHHKLDDAILHAQQAGVTVFALVEPSDHARFSGKPNRGLKVAKRFAEESGGEAYSIESLKDVELALQNLQLLLRNSYAVKYQAIAQPTKDGKVSLRIEVHRKDVKLIASRQRPPAFPQ